MRKMITAAILGGALLGAAVIGRGEPMQSIQLPGEAGEKGPLVQVPDERGESSLIQPLAERGGLRKLLLNSIGTGQLGPGEVRIPIPFNGAMWEVIVVKPSEPKLMPVAKNDAD